MSPGANNPGGPVKDRRQKMKILNLTQHLATPEQIIAGVVEPRQKTVVQKLLTLDGILPPGELSARAAALAFLADAELDEEYGGELDEEGGRLERLQVMIGGAPCLMAPLERALRALRMDPVYSFSVRESTEQLQPDGSVRKYQTFRHSGFQPAEVVGG